MILNDVQILELIGDGMIAPYHGTMVRKVHDKPVVSYGLGSFGYDIRLGNDFKRPVGSKDLPSIVPWDEQYKHMRVSIFDPHDSDTVRYMEWEAKSGYYIIDPGEMVLARSFELFNMPEDVMAICLGKSTYARCGLFVNVTPLEPGWRGVLTMELSNIGHVPIKVYCNEGIAQLVFFKGEKPGVTYSDRSGKYMDQTGVTPAKI